MFEKLEKSLHVKKLNGEEANLIVRTCPDDHIRHARITSYFSLNTLYFHTKQFFQIYNISS
jgi:hypothetical protein